MNALVHFFMSMKADFKRPKIWKVDKGSPFRRRKIDLLQKSISSLKSFSVVSKCSLVAHLELDPHAKENGSSIQDEPSNSTREQFDALKVVGKNKSGFLRSILQFSAYD